MLSSLRQRLQQEGFLKHVATLMTGTTVAQAIMLLAAPVLTRLYSPEQFGLFGLYTTAVGFLAIVVTGKYDLAILLPAEDRDAARLVWLSLGITFSLCLLMALGLIVLQQPLQQLIGGNHSDWLWLLPLATAAQGIYLTLNAWNNRLKRYRQIAINRAAQSLSIVGSQLGLGWLMADKGSQGLILGSFFGYLLAALWWSITTWRSDSALLRRPGLAGIRAQAHQHADLPRYAIATDLLSYVFFQMPIAVLTSFFGVQAVGYYSLTQRVLGVPMVFIASSVGDVFRQRASADYAQRGECLDIFRSTFRNLSLLVIAPAILLAIIAPDLFAWIFGEPWRDAGYYARILLPMFVCKFVTNPLSYVFLITGRQKLDLILHLLMLGVLAAGMSWVLHAWRTEYGVLAVFSAAYSVMYVVYLILSWRFAHGRASAPLCEARS